MRSATFALLGVLMLGSVAHAHGDGGDFGGSGLGGFGDGFGVFGFSGHRDGFGGGFGLNLADNADLIQTHFETRFDTIKTSYDTGVADTTDFFTSTAYDTIVTKTESLSDRYDFFVSGVQNTIDRLTDVISNTNDDITFYDDLLTKYQADDSISAAKLDRIELWISHITDRLNSRVDSLTTDQTTLQTNLPTYQSFQTDLSTFLSDIQTAGSGSTGATTTSAKSLFNAATTSTAVGSSGSMCASTASALSTGVVPEPSLTVLLAAGGGLSLLYRGRRRRRW